MEPVITGLISAASAADKSDAAADVSLGLLQRVFGPSADEVGTALARWTSYRVGNAKRIVEGADKKSGGRTGSSIPPRLAHKLLEDGSYCDDEVMVDYLSGVLAGGRTEQGKDDRAVSWSVLVTGMSSLQVRAHYILYRAWCEALAPREDLHLGDHDLRSKCVMILDWMEFARALLGDNLDLDADPAVRHAVIGLISLDLLQNDFALGGKEHIGESSYPYSIKVNLTLRGMELWGWARGVPDMTGFSESPGIDEEFDSSIPRVEHFLPLFPKRQEEAGGAPLGG